MGAGGTLGVGARFYSCQRKVVPLLKVQEPLGRNLEKFFEGQGERCIDRALVCDNPIYARFVHSKHYGQNPLGPSPFLQ